MLLSEFTRIYPMRAQNIMWFFGAGSSATAGIATAGEMLWEFKRSIYCSNEKISFKRCGDLTDERTRYRIQNYIEANVPDCPKPGAEDEYAFFFERAYASEIDRRTYIESKITSATPSFGHECLGILLKMGLVRLMWTTNFDRVVEDVAVRVLGSTSKIVVAALDHAALGLQAINEDRWPVYIKVHGDFQSRKLKNTTAELLTQDAKMRQSLIDCSKRFGMAVVGYSGRDNSVMEAMENALTDGAFPNGLFWFRRDEKSTYPRVAELINKAKSLGIEAEFVEMESFDELFGDLLTQIPNVPDGAIEALQAQKPRLTEASMPAVGSSTSFPILRLNAIPILEHPSILRLIDCQVGGTSEVKELLTTAGANAIAVRSKPGVLCFGSDSELKKIFDKHGIVKFDLKEIDASRLKFHSAEMGLLYDALIAALVRSRPLLANARRGNRILYVDKQRQSDSSLIKLKTSLRDLTGIANGVPWAEGVRLRLDYKFGRLWLIFEPAIWISDKAGKEFVRSRMTKRYNGDWNNLIARWGEILAGPGKKEIRALGIGDGVDATFVLDHTTAFSRRLQ